MGSKLEAVRAENLPYEVFANRVDVGTVYKDEHSTVWTFSVNAGVGGINMGYKEKHALLKDSYATVVDNTFCAFNRDDVLLYTVDLSQFVKEGRQFSVIPLTAVLREFILISEEPGYKAPTRLLTPADVFSEGDEPCDDPGWRKWSFEEPIRCHRELSHQGKHENLGEVFSTWSKSGAHGRVAPEYGVPTTCVQCGFAWGGNGTETYCSECAGWLKRAESYAEERAALKKLGPNSRSSVLFKTVVGNNTLYNIDKTHSAFGGRPFDLKYLPSGTDFSACLWYYSDIPEYFQHLFPANVEFNPTKNPTVGRYPLV